MLTHPPWLHAATHLVEVQGVQQVCELPVLLLLVQHDVVLHQAVQRQLALVVHVDLCWLQTQTSTTAARDEADGMGVDA